MHNGPYIEQKAKKRKKNGLAVLVGREANTKESSYVEVIFDDCGQRFHDSPPRNGLA
jgi:hypothetical protein